MSGSPSELELRYDLMTRDELIAECEKLRQALQQIVDIADNDEEADCYEHTIARRALTRSVTTGD